MTGAGLPLLELAERIAGWARDGEQVEAYVSRGKETEVEIYDGDIESLSQAESSGIGIRVVKGSRQGFAYAGSLDEGIVSETLEDARDNAGFATEDIHVGLAQPDGSAAADLNLWREELAGYPASEKVDAALELDRLGRSCDPLITQVASASWSDTASESAIATSTGISAQSRRTSCAVSAALAAGDGPDKQLGYGWSVGRGPAEIDLGKAAKDAAARATRLLGARKPASAHLTVVFEPMITASFLAILGQTLNGESVLKGRSLFANRVGEPVSVPGVSLVNDPTEADAYGARVFDAEGLPTRRTSLIESGTLRGFLFDTYAARRAGVVSTAAAVRAGFKSPPGTGAVALALDPGEATPEEVYSRVGDGVLIQSVSGLHSGVNPVSGDFSVGAEGVLIRGGELAGPVHEFTIASTIQRMLKGVVELGSDLEHLPSSAAGLTLAVSDMSMSGS